MKPTKSKSGAIRFADGFIYNKKSLGAAKAATAAKMTAEERALGGPLVPKSFKLKPV
jgi:hypothetical protein